MTEDKLDIIIQLLTEIKIILCENDPKSALAEKPRPVKKLTKKQQLHQDALEAIEHHRRLDKKKAEKMFAPEREKLRLLEEEVAKLEDQCNK